MLSIDVGIWNGIHTAGFILTPAVVGEWVMAETPNAACLCCGLVPLVRTSASLFVAQGHSNTILTLVAPIRSHALDPHFALDLCLCLSRCLLRIRHRLHFVGGLPTEKSVTFGAKAPEPLAVVPDADGRLAMLSMNNGSTSDG